MTAVAGSSNKVGGKKTQIVGLRPLERSVQLRAAVLRNAVAHSAATKKNQNRKIRARDWNDTHRTHEQHRSAAVAVLIAVMGTRGCTISATLAESEEQLQKSFSSAGASHEEFELLRWNVSRRDATGCIDAVGEVSDVTWAPPRAHGGLPARVS